MAGLSDLIASPFNKANEILQKLLSAKGIIEYGDTIRELHQQFIAMSVSARAAHDKIEALEREVAELKANNAQRERYELKELPPGVLVMALKEGVQPAEPPHYACEKCFGDGKLRRLQKQPRERNGLSEYVCNGCETTLEVGNFVRPQPVQTRRYNPLGRR
jgi:hypothetical protein